MLPATVLAWNPRPGQAALTVVVKATFDLTPVVAQLAAVQEPLVEHDQHWDDDASRFLVAASDLVPMKRRVDVVYLGPVTGASPARLTVGLLDKVADPRAGHWPLAPLRAPAANAAAEAWRQEWSTRPRPEEAGAEVFNVAPPDQQLDALAHDAPVRLENLSPAAPVLRTALPGLRPTAQIEVSGNPPQLVSLRLDTLTIDGERGLMFIVWRGHSPIEHPSQIQRVVIGAGTSPGTAPSVGAPSRPIARTALAPVEASAARAAASSKPLPFAAGARSSTALPSSSLTTGQTSGWGASSLQRETAEIPVMLGEPRTGLSAANSAAPQPPAPPAFGPAAYGSPQPAPPPAPPLAPPLAPPPAPPPATGAAPTPSSGWTPSFAAPPQAPAIFPARPAPAFGGPQHLASAALGGLGAASDAAADGHAAQRSSTGGRRARRPASAFSLLWHDTDQVLAVRLHPAWTSILAKRELRPAGRSRALESPEAEDASEMIAIVRDGDVASESGIADALDRGFREEGDFQPELCLVEGELRFQYDELETLRAVMATAQPHLAKDDRLRAATEGAMAFLSSPGLVSPPVVARGLTDDVRSAWAAWSARSLPADHLDRMAARALLEKRAYQKRDLFGGPHLRASLALPHSTTPIPTYLPEAAARKLPLYLGMKSRLIAFVHVREDEDEESHLALRIVVLARTIGEESTKS